MTFKSLIWRINNKTTLYVNYSQSTPNTKYNIHNVCGPNPIEYVLARVKSLVKSLGFCQFAMQDVCTIDLIKMPIYMFEIQ